MEKRKSFTSKKIFDYLKLAGRLALKKRDGRSFYHGAIAFRADGACVQSSNGFSSFPERLSHCEARLARKLDRGAVVYLARVRKGDGTLSNSRPCASCEKILRTHNVKKVYYSISENEYGVLTF